MRPRAALVLVVLLLAGCARAPAFERPEHLLPETLYLSDSLDGDLEPAFDLRALGVRELNGSLLFTLTFENLSGRLPEFSVQATLVTGAGSREYFVRNEAALDRPKPHLRWRWGVVVEGEEEARGEICAVSSTTRPPWVIQAELTNNASGLLDGGRLERVRVRVADFEGRETDGAEASLPLALRGGANPHPTCPLLTERPRAAS